MSDRRTVVALGKSLVGKLLQYSGTILLASVPVLKDPFLRAALEERAAIKLDGLFQIRLLASSD
jgi:hypothetical protein